MKSALAQKEEEIVYLRARLHTQDLELCELQHVRLHAIFFTRIQLPLLHKHLALGEGLPFPSKAEGSS